MATITGTAGNDTFTVSSTLDTIFGLEGDDTYIYTLLSPSSAMQIEEEENEGTDTLEFDSTLTFADLDFSLDTYAGRNNILILHSTGNGVRIFDQMDSDRVERIKFSDGSEYSLSGITMTSLDNSGATIVGGSGELNLYGGTGNDIMTAGDGTKIYGGAGNDTITTTASTGESHGGTGNDTLIGNAYGNDLYGDAGDDFIDFKGGQGNNIYGGDGDDTITGDRYSTGSINNAYGGNGNDTYIYKSRPLTVKGNLHISEGAAEGTLDTLEFESGIAFADLNFATEIWGGTNNLLITQSTTNGVRILNQMDSDRVERIEFIDGNQYSLSGNTMTALDNSGATIVGGSGELNLYGGTGNDIMTAGNGTKIYGGTGNDTITTTASTGESHGGAGNDTLIGNTYGNDLYGDAGDDYINYKGGQGNNIYGGDGNDIISGDRYSTGSINNAYGGNGNDTYIYKSRPLTVKGNLHIYEGDNEGTADTIAFESGISFSDLTLAADSWGGTSNLLITQSTSNGVRILDQGTSTRIEYLTFADGSVYELNGLTASLTTTVNSDIVLTPLADTYTASANNETIYALESDDTVNGAGGDDIIYGMEGNDTLNGGAGDDTLDGGSGVDTASYADAAAAVRVFLNSNLADEGRDGIWNDSFISIENIVGSAYGDQILGDNNANVIYGGAGNDDLRDNGGNDTIWGGDGDDDIYGGAGDDVYHGEAGDDYIQALSGLNTVYGGDGVDTVLGGTEADTIYGDAGNDILSGNAGNDTLNGNAGEDWVSGGDGDDIIRGGTEDDTLNGDAGNDMLYGDDGADLLLGHDGNDTLYGGAGNDDLRGYDGDDILWGGDGDDLFYDLSALTGQGNDTYHGEGGDDTFYTYSGTNIVNGGAGNDTVYGGAGVDTIHGDDGNDWLRGGDGNDVIYGGADINFDQIYGEAGDDTIYGGEGNDRLIGGSGADTFVFEATTALNGNDTIYDFSTGDGDALDISNLLTAYDPLTDLLTDFVEITDDGTQSYLKVDADGGANSFTQVAFIVNATGLTDEDALVTSGNLVV